MLNVIIADDEGLIREGLHEFVPWGDFDMRVVALAESGKQAIELIDALKPDICILDIKMPFVNGLEVAEHFKSVNPDGLSIFFTGYDDFSYAVRALRASAFDFLKKPLNMSEMLKVLGRAQEHLLNKQVTHKNINDALSQINNNIDIMRRGFLMRWIGGELSEAEIAGGIEFYRLRELVPCGIIYTRVNGSLDGAASPQLRVEDAIRGILRDFEDNFTVSLEPGLTFLSLLPVKNPDKWVSLEKTMRDSLRDSVGKRIDCLFAQCGDPSGIARCCASMREAMSRNLAMSPILQLLLEQIHTAYSYSDLMLAEFAQKYNVNSSYLSRLFKQELGQNYSDYLASYRVGKSLGYLANPDIKIYRVAELVGYKNQYYFSESFKKIIGISPSDYRKQACG